MVFGALGGGAKETKPPVVRYIDLNDWKRQGVFYWGDIAERTQITANAVTQAIENWQVHESIQARIKRLAAQQGHGEKLATVRRLQVVEWHLESAFGRDGMLKIHEQAQSSVYWDSIVAPVAQLTAWTRQMRTLRELKGKIGDVDKQRLVQENILRLAARKPAVTVPLDTHRIQTGILRLPTEFQALAQDVVHRPKEDNIWATPNEVLTFIGYVWNRLEKAASQWSERVWDGTSMPTLMHAIYITYHHDLRSGTSQKVQSAAHTLAMAQTAVQQLNAEASHEHTFSQFRAQLVAKLRSRPCDAIRAKLGSKYGEIETLLKQANSYGSFYQALERTLKDWYQWERARLGDARARDLPETVLAPIFNLLLETWQPQSSRGQA